MSHQDLKMSAYLKFKELHNQKHPLIVGNVWNVQSAKVFEKLNFQAIGTSSSAIANTLGYDDGEEMPFAALLFIVKRIRRSVSLPLTVDIEFGYGANAEAIASNIVELEKLGVVGINIEDSFVEQGERKLKDGLLFSQLLIEVNNVLKQNGISMFINVRCDAFLLNVPNPLQVASERIERYEQAGTDGIFLPCIARENDIAEMVSKTKLPLNVMCMPLLPNFKKLGDIGVKRISMGNFINHHTYASLENRMTRILHEESFRSLF